MSVVCVREEVFTHLMSVICVRKEVFTLPLSVVCVREGCSPAGCLCQGRGVHPPCVCVREGCSPTMCLCQGRVFTYQVSVSGKGVHLPGVCVWEEVFFHQMSAICGREEVFNHQVSLATWPTAPAAKGLISLIEDRFAMNEKNVTVNSDFLK